MKAPLLRTLAVAAVILIPGGCGRPAAPQTEQNGGLIVVVVIDQLPQYLVERYDTLFTGGFRRLLDHGRTYTQAFQEHSRTSTAPGHTTIATGLYPYRHGIVANSWRERVDDAWVDVENFADSTESIIGRDRRGFSPRKLEVSTLADWLRTADPDTRVFSVSGKVRGAVPLAGRGRGHVYVFDESYGPTFVTSTYYRSDVPPWVRRFNEGRLAELLADSVWESNLPPPAAWASRPDTTEYEHGGRYVDFPHEFRAEEEAWGSDHEDYLDWWQHTPMSDIAAIELAKTALSALELGQRASVDLMALALSATDRIGHMYGPFRRSGRIAIGLPSRPITAWRRLPNTFRSRVRTLDASPRRPCSS
jgi:predicted AlkP superfamily pyrophosphatase or phosphodiesterase